MKKFFLLYVGAIFLSCDYKKTIELDFIEENAIESNIESQFIIGDFNGDGINDTLTEVLKSSIDGKLINKLPEIEYDSLVEFIHKKEPNLSLKSSNLNIPELIIDKANASFGFLWLKNEGDLNNDGSDEISFIIDWADWSAVNKCRVYTFVNGKWKELLNFEIREWQLYDSEEGEPFGGFITKNENGEFLIDTFDEEAIEIQVPLKSLINE